MARIIVIEDESSTRALVSGVLSKLGHKVSAFDNGAEGLLMIMAELPDLVVSDVQMPKMTGFEVLTHVRQDAETAQIPFILLTSLSDEGDIRHGLSQGANDYITKPFQPAQLIESITQQLTEAAERRGQVLSLIPDELAVQTNAAQAPQPQPQQELSLKPEEPDNPLRDTDQPMGTAWLMHIEVHNAEDIAYRLSSKDWRAVLRHLFLPVSRDPLLRSAQYLEMDEHRLMLTYCDAAFGAHQGAAAAYAAQAVDIMTQAGDMTRRWAAQQYDLMRLPALRIVISLHHGEVAVRRVPLPYGGSRDAVVGQAADLVTKLRSGEPPVMWRVMATEAAFAASVGLYKPGAQMEISVGNVDAQVRALQGLAEGETSWI